jgi:hypothetical protein
MVKKRLTPNLGGFVFNTHSGLKFILNLPKIQNPNSSLSFKASSQNGYKLVQKLFTLSKRHAYLKKMPISRLWQKKTV